MYFLFLHCLKKICVKYAKSENKILFFVKIDETKKKKSIKIKV